VGSDWLWISVAAVGLALVPMLITLGPAAWYNVRDPEMIRLHNFITEFFTYRKFHPHEPLESWFRTNGVLPLFLIGAVLLSGSQRLQLHDWAALWFSSFFCFFFMLLAMWQNRWTWHYGAMSVWLTVIVGHIAWRNVLAARGKRFPVELVAIGSAVVLIQAIFFAAREYINVSEIRSREFLATEMLDAVMKKNLAQGLGAMNREQNFRFICEPDLSPALYYFGGIRSVTSYYWENVEGLHSATEFFDDLGDAAAHRVARERGLTHVLVSADPEVPVMFSYIKTGKSSTQATRPTLLERLRRGGIGIPSWMELDPDLTRIGQQHFELVTAAGKAPWESRFRVYRIRLNEL
jgi:hypothetical protein